ncbi:hypothetical protein OR1_03089 [Geobacter sp. OR-1]|nr:hypothetical protein OR1_03089 [Geobacter sp. OR-1]
MDEEVAKLYRVVLATNGPVKLGPGAEELVPVQVAKDFGWRSQICEAIHPKIGKPWMFGLHQCSYARVWTEEEERILQEIGRRLADTMTGLLMYRDLHESEERYRMVFENSPVSIWEEDFSAVKAIFDDLKNQGVTDIEQYLTKHPETVLHCAEQVKIIDINQATLALHGAATKEELFAGLVNTFTPESFETFRKELVCLWNGGTNMTQDAVVKTLTGEPRQVTVYFSICPGTEQTFSKILVSLIDITERHQAEEQIMALNEQLENRVRERTAELAAKNTELERMNKIFIGRELRMIDLKKRIRELETET